MTASDFQTDLVLTGIGIAPYSSRALNHQLTPIASAVSLRRDINGTLVDLSESQFRKYRLTIRGSDAQPPALNGIWPGMAVTVDCAMELAYEDTTDGAPDRTAVPGSTRTADGYVYYRPRLSMLVVDCPQSFAEWDCETGWSIVLEEV